LNAIHPFRAEDNLVTRDCSARYISTKMTIRSRPCRIAEVFDLDKVLRRRRCKPNTLRIGYLSEFCVNTFLAWIPETAPRYSSRKSCGSRYGRRLSRHARAFDPRQHGHMCWFLRSRLKPCRAWFLKSQQSMALSDWPEFTRVRA